MKEIPELPTISDAQREIMNLVWDQGEVGVAEVWRILSARRPLARNTILTLITRLVDKGWLRTRRVGNAFRYTAAWPREKAQADELRRLVETVFDGSAEGLVMTLLEGGGLSPAESERIRAMIVKANRKPSTARPQP
jgi:BlaI family transcriptional regulator, penicillinase repressor